MNAPGLLIVGGGITGLGIARLAARQGWPVTLIEREDLCSGASAATSHMLHGGLRYLEHGQFGLVREALHERAALTRMAPQLARPARFLVPLHAHSRLAPWKLRAGLALYDLLAGAHNLAPHGFASRDEALTLEPALAADTLRGAGMYSDSVMDDARLAIAVARDAAAHGARIHVRTTVRALRPSPDAPGAFEVTLAGDGASEGPVTARVIVNATGSASDATRRELLRLLRPGAAEPQPRLAPTRGVHLVYPALTRSHGVLVTAASDGRVWFVVPFAGRSLVGTTEVATLSPPEVAQTAPSAEEVRYLVRELARVLPQSAALRPLAVYAGVRPLLAPQRGEPGRASREHLVTDDGPLLSIAGGKYTTFRVMARDVVRAAARKLGADPAQVRESDDALPAPLAPGAMPEALGVHAATHEFARTLHGAMRRRSTLWLADDAGLGAAPDVARGMAHALGWDEAHLRTECETYAHTVRSEREWLARALGTDSGTGGRR